jgi:UDPglucose 6-dehydrogenase
MARTFSVIGLGKLGASMAAGIASHGHNVIGVDVNPRAVELVNAGQAPVQETGLDEMIRANRERIRATQDTEDAILNSELTFCIVPTPSDERGAFSLQYAAFAFREIGKALAKKSEYHTVVLTSTVLPGATRFGLVPILERYSGKTCGKDFGLCYSPEFVALGSVIRDFLNPDFLLIGEFDERSGAHLENSYTEIVSNKAPARRMSLENAELTKISVNAYVTTKITFANLMAEMCQRIPGGDVDIVSNALGMDSRIGKKYLTGGLGYGGPCFPRDSVALAFMAKAIGVPNDLPATTDRLNRSLSDRVSDVFRRHIGRESTVAVLGLSYKPFSHVIEESAALALVRSCLQHGIRVIGYDPLAGEMANADLKGRAVVLNSAAECIKQADVVLVATPDPEFVALTARDFTDGSRKVTVVDFWRILAGKLQGQPGIQYVAYGRGGSSGDHIAKLKELWTDGQAV